MPRLHEGEIAPGIAVKQARRKEIVQHIINALDETLATPGKVNIEIQKVFSSYRKLANWTDKERDIEPMSENTLRKNLDELYPGGIRAFEDVRKKFLKSLRTKAPTPGTKASYQESNVLLKEENQILANHILIFSAQYLDLLEKTSDMANTHVFLQDYLKAHHNSYPNAYQGLRVVTGNRKNE